jgi:hypothetical protein
MAQQSYRKLDFTASMSANLRFHPDLIDRQNAFINQTWFVD